MSEAKSEGSSSQASTETNQPPLDDQGQREWKTVEEAREWGSCRLRERDINHPGLTADLLLAHVLNVPRLELPLRSEDRLSDDARTTFHSLIRERIERRPLEYITGEAEFFGYSFDIDERALIPRPETERLVECVRAQLADNSGATANRQSRKICDLGVGSGVILLTLCLECQNLEGVGVDVSSRALELAGENARKHGMEESVELIEGDFLEADTMDRLKQRGPFDAVVSNPPYVRADELDELQPEVREHEPEIALKAPVERTRIFRNLIKQADRMTTDDGCFAMEMSETDHPNPEKVKADSSFSNVRIESDHRGAKRLLLAD